MVKISNSIKVVAITLVIFFSINSNGYAQETSNDTHKDAITFGLAHSLNYTNITGSFPSKNIDNLKTTISVSSPRLTFDVGMSIDYYFNNRLSLQFDLLYTYIGAHLLEKTTIYNEIGVIDNNKYYTYATSYFKFPLLLNFYPVPLLYVNGGGYFAPLIASSSYYHWYDQREPIEDIKPFDYGFVVGFGLNLKYVKLGFQYSYGISDFIDNNSFDLHHNVFELTARWKFYSDIRTKINK